MYVGPQDFDGLDGELLERAVRCLSSRTRPWTRDEQAASALDFIDRGFALLFDATYDPRAMAELPPTIPQLVARAAERFGDSEAVVDGDVRLSFAEFADAIDEAARALIASGIEAGDRIAIWAPNIVRVGRRGARRTHTVGGVVIPLNTRFKGAEAGYVIGAAEARLLFTVTDFLDTDYVELLRDAPGTESLEEIVVLRGTVPDGCTSWEDFLSARRRRRSGERRGARRGRHPDDLCDILFTSGTTGAPKGAMLFHSASMRAYEAWSDVVGLREGDRYLVINPFFHSFGLKAGILACLMKGATHRAASGLRRALGDAAGRRGKHHDAARARRPSSRRSSTIPTSTRTTCPRCGWR